MKLSLTSFHDSGSSCSMFEYIRKASIASDIGSNNEITPFFFTSIATSVAVIPAGEGIMCSIRWFEFRSWCEVVSVFATAWMRSANYSKMGNGVQIHVPESLTNLRSDVEIVTK